MSAHLTATLVLYAAFLGVWAAGCAALGRARPPTHRAGLWLLELLLVAHAAGDAVGLLGGHRPAETATHFGYLVASVLILPLVAFQAEGEDSAWDGIVVTVACVATAVVALRLQSTWPAARA